MASTWHSCAARPEWTPARIGELNLAWSLVRLSLAGGGGGHVQKAQRIDLGFGDQAQLVPEGMMERSVAAHPARFGMDRRRCDSLCGLRPMQNRSPPFACGAGVVRMGTFGFLRHGAMHGHAHTYTYTFAYPHVSTFIYTSSFTMESTYIHSPMCTYLNLHI